MHSSASGINDNGQVVGRCNYGIGGDHAAAWTNGTITDLGTLGGNSSYAQDINNSGQIVGYANTTTTNGVYHANTGLPP